MTIDGRGNMMLKKLLTIIASSGLLVLIAPALSAQAMTQAECNANVPGGSGTLVNLSSGNDTVSYVNAGYHLCIDGKGGSDDITGGQVGDYILGSGGGDDLHGSYGNDVIMGGDGSDHLWGNQDNDNMQGQAAYDYLWGGLGNDTMRGLGAEGTGDDYNVDDDSTSDDVWPGSNSSSIWGTSVDYWHACASYPRAMYHVHGNPVLDYVNGPYYCFTY